MLVFNGPAVVEAVISNLTWWPCAVSADINVLALEKRVSRKVGGSVLLAGGIWDSVFHGVLVDTTWVSTVAGSTSSAVNNNLGVESNWGWALISLKDIESISKGGGGALSPA